MLLLVVLVLVLVVAAGRLSTSGRGHLLIFVRSSIDICVVCDMEEVAVVSGVYGWLEGERLVREEARTGSRRQA